MESQDPLSELADIHLPSVISFWPPAYGWWILAALVILAAVYLLRANNIRQDRNRHLGNAINELEKTYSNYSKRILLTKSKNQAGLDFLNQVNAILRRVALVRCPETTTNEQALAQLSGKDWLTFLDSCDNTSSFSKGPGKALGEGVYQRKFSANSEALYKLAQQWIENRYKSNLQEPTGAPSW